MDISEVVDFEPSEPESSKEPSYPDGITQKDSLTLEFKSKSKKVNAVFSAVFSEINSDTEPNDGIYLQTNNGKATLLLDFVENEGITQDDLVNYSFIKGGKFKEFKQDGYEYLLTLEWDEYLRLPIFLAAIIDTLY